MANLKDIKQRIKSIKSTKKITKAMQMVSASKLKNSKDLLDKALPYYNSMENMLYNFLANLELEQKFEHRISKLLFGVKNSKKHLIIITSSNRGLCGGFNSNIIKNAKRYMNELLSLGEEFDLIVVGSKAYNNLKHGYSNNIIKYYENLYSGNVDFNKTLELANDITNIFLESQYNSAKIFYNKFISVLSQETNMENLFPIIDEKENNIGNETQIYNYEPGQLEILPEIINKSIHGKLYYIMLENSTSEHGARTTAMDNASRNAENIIQDLTLVYNRTRQAMITKELIEIISGAEAL